MNTPTRSLNPARRELLKMFALDTEMVSGSGFSLRDAKGLEYLDFLSQYGALPFGHNPPDIWKALNTVNRDQIPVMIQPLRSLDAERLADRLAEVTPGDLAITTFTNSGAEAVEAALSLRACAPAAVISCPRKTASTARRWARCLQPARPFIKKDSARRSRGSNTCPTAIL